MTKKQIESKIKMEANSLDVPDLKQQILARVPNRKVIEPKRKGSFVLRLSYLMAVFVFGLVAFLTINSFIPTGNLDGSSPTDNPKTPLSSISTVNKAYANGASTVVGFVGGLDSGVSGMSAFIYDLNSYLTMAEEIEKYFHAVSRLLDEDSTSYEYLESEDSNYQYKLVITNYVLEDEYVTVMYYNEEEILSDKSNKKLTKISGIVYPNGLNDDSYMFFGEEVVKNENESTYKLTVEFSLDSYITAIIEEETEKDDIEFEYAYYFHTSKNSYKQAYKTVSIEIENSRNGREVEIEIAEGAKEIEMEFIYDETLEDKHVDIKFNGHDEFRVSVDKEDHDKYSYDHKGEDGYEHVHGGDKYHGHRQDEDFKSDNDKDDRKTV